MVTRRTGWCAVWACAALVVVPAWAQDGGAPAAPTPPAQPAAPEAPQELPPAEALFERHVEQVGGREVFEKLETRLMEGSFKSSMGVAAFATMYFEKPNRLAVLLEVPGAQTVSTVYDGEVGWRQTGGVVELVEGAELTDLVESADFFGELNWKRRYTNLRTVEAGRFDGRLTYRVAYESVAGKRGFHFFDEESGYFFGTQTTTTMGGQERGIFVTLRDYEPFGEVKFPTVIRQQLGTDIVVTYEFSRIDFETKRPELFERPARVTELLAEREAGSGG